MKLYGVEWPEHTAKSSEEWDKIREEWEKKHPIQAWYKRSIYYPVRRFANKWLNPMDYYREVKWFIQRGRRGWSNRDAWGFYAFHSKVTYEALVWLKKHKCGTPCDMFPEIPEDQWRQYTAEEEALAIKKWEETLDKMIYAFEMLKKAHWDGTAEVFVPSKEDPNKHALADTSWSRKYPDHYLMTKEEDDRIKEGMQLFIKHYESLWD